MKRINKKAIRVLFGKYLREHRTQVLHVPHVRTLAVLNQYDSSKMNKIEKGLIDTRFDTLIDIASIYRMDLKDLFSFTVSSLPVKKAVK